MGRRARCAWVLALALSACAVQRPWSYRVALAAGDRALVAGRFREAAEAYDRAATETRRPMDRDEALYRAAQAWRRAGEEARALQRFEWVAQHGVPEARDPRAALEAGRLRLDRGEREAGEADLTALVLERPNTGPARRALFLVLSSLDARDESGAEALHWIDRVLPQVANTELVSALWLERARRYDVRDERREAERSYEAMLAVPYPQNSHWDDGGLLFLRTLRRWGRPGDAVALAERLLGAREVSSIVPGSYERPSFAALEFARAETLLEDLHDGPAAAEGFHRVYERHRDSRLRDDALAREAAVLEALGRSADACERWSRLAREFPCTRFGRQGTERALACGVAQESLGAGCERRRPRGDAGVSP